MIDDKSKQAEENKRLLEKNDKKDEEIKRLSTVYSLW